ncbi:MAG TPA: pilus assembly protein TadG-related protein [Terriglobia bacterium]|nr:pilus assembly protein TadG-related protein [Terriglobia bacterium]
MKHPQTVGGARRRLRVPADDGQVSVFVALVVTMFLLLFVGFGVDMTNLYFHRQAAQGAADAACIAGATDMYAKANGSTSLGGFTTGTAFDCASTPGAAPCKYAALNGYSGAGLTAGKDSNKVSVSFPATVAGVNPAPTAVTGGWSFMEVDVVDRVKVYFSSLVSGSKTTDVMARARCGMVTGLAPVPLIVLDPTCSHALEIGGSSTVAIIGGPVRSVEVNSDNTGCAAATDSSANTCSGNGTIDLSKGGPNFTGGQIGIFGAPSTSSKNFLPGTSGGWIQPAAPVQDPFKLLAPPSQPALAPAPVSVGYGVHGCPDTSGCSEYSAGLYTTAISVKGFTAIFDPGVYYILPPDAKSMDKDSCGSGGSGCLASKPTGSCHYDFAVDSGGIVRPSTVAGDGTGGTMFYLSGTGGANGTYGSVFFGSNAGKSNNNSVDTYQSSGVTCPGGPAPDPPLPTTLAGDVLLGPCTGSYTDSSGKNRGMVFFQDRSNADLNGQPAMQGGGGLLLGGNLYFHNCPESLTGPCAAPTTDYNAFLSLQGSPGSSTYIYGNITTDELAEGGNGTVYMELNPNAKYSIVKVALLQ